MELGGNLSTADENGSADLHRFFDYRTARHAGVLGVIWPNENLFLCSFFFVGEHLFLSSPSKCRPTQCCDIFTNLHSLPSCVPNVHISDYSLSIACMS